MRTIETIARDLEDQKELVLRAQRKLAILQNEYETAVEDMYHSIRSKSRGSIGGIAGA